MPSKQAGRGKAKAYMGHHEEEIGCLPKFNYSNGFGWKKKKVHQRGNAFGNFSIIRKLGGYANKVRLG